MDRGLLPHDHFSVGGRCRSHQRAGTASLGADSTTLGWRSAWIPPFTCYRMDRAASVLVLVGNDGAYMDVSARHCPCPERVLLALCNWNDNCRRHRIGGGNCDVLAVKVLPNVNERRGPVRHGRSDPMAMLSRRFLVSNCTSLASCQDGWKPPTSL